MKFNGLGNTSDNKHLTKAELEAKEINDSVEGLDTSYFNEHFESAEEIIIFVTFALGKEFKSGVLNKTVVFDAIKEYVKEMNEAKYDSETDALFEGDPEYSGKYKVEIFNEFWIEYTRVVEVCEEKASKVSELSSQPKQAVNKTSNSILSIIK